MVTAAPLILITVAGVVLLVLLPEPDLPAVLFAMVANAAAILLLFFQPQTAFVRDTGDGAHVYKK